MQDTIPNTVRPDLTAIHGDLTFSKQSVYLWVALTPVHYEFLDYNSREKIAVDVNNALANILNNDEVELLGHLIVTSKTFDAAKWRTNYIEIMNKTANPTPVFNAFTSQMEDLLYNYNFREKRVLIGVHIGKRLSYKPMKEITKIPFLDKFLTSFTGEVDEYLTEEELAYWEDKAKLVRYSLLNGEMGAEPVFPSELAYIVRKYFFPAMPAPTVEDLAITGASSWGAGEIQTLTDADITNTPRWLKIEQSVDGVVHTGYRATLAIAKFPDALRYPENEPWIHQASTLPFPVDIHIRFNVVPSQKVKKQVTNRIKEIQDQRVNMTSAGGSVSLEVEANYELGKYLEFALSQSDTPWIYGRHRIIVEAETEEELNERVQAVQDHYKKRKILVVWPPGDQMSLMLECLPNDKVRENSYYQRHELGIIGAGVPAGSSGVGDKVIRLSDTKTQGWLGAYLGYTDSRIAEPVFLSIHATIAQNEAPGLVITGSPGSGKSGVAFTLTYNMVVSGVQTVYIDPKNDALPLATLPGCENTTIIDINDSPDGVLDPFQIGEDEGEKIDLANETISFFVGGINNLTPNAQADLSRSITLVLKDRVPTMTKLTEILKHSRDPDARALGERLALMKKLPFARLCFYDSAHENIKKDVLKLNNRLTILTLLGLDLPPSLTKKEDYTNRNRLAVSILFLLANYIKRVVIGGGRDDTHPRAIVIDEAWAITSTAQGAKMVLEIARLGRSMNTGLVLVSQNAGDFLDEGITNSVSMRMCFGTKDTKEAQNVLRFIGLDDNEDNLGIVNSLVTGQCLVRDSHGRISRMVVDRWNPQLAHAFETNPNTKRENAERNNH